MRGDEVTVTSGLKAGDLVVSAGQVKLTNGQEVQIKAATGTAPAPTPAGTKPQ